MINLARIASWLALAATLVPPILFFYDWMTLDQTKLWMVIATMGWFATAPIWMERPRPE